ncbi:hypothetical protein [Streptomyces sp. DT203]|uniref:hypothetical protein n=1 Tax=Streptomyces sp. DT203 TaxID=3393424 RepID=UPI003CF16297
MGPSEGAVGHLHPLDLAAERSRSDGRAHQRHQARVENHPYDGLLVAVAERIVFSVTALSDDTDDVTANSLDEFRLPRGDTRVVPPHLQVQAQADAAGAVDWLVQIDSAVVRAHQHAAATGRAEKGAPSAGRTVDPEEA